MKNKEISKEKERQNKIFSDHHLRFIDEQVLNVYNFSIPEMMFVKKTGEFIVKYDQKTEDLVARFKKTKQEYTDHYYPEAKGD